MEIKSRADAMAWLTGARGWNTGNVTSRAAGNNTRVHLWDDERTLSVRLHVTDVVVYREDGSTSLHTGGWRTVTTKDRLNKHCPPGWAVYSSKGVWYLIHRDGRRYTFHEGITVHANGTVTGDGGQEPQGKKLADDLRAVKEYAAGFLRELFAGRIKPPSLGDCWYCLMRVGQGEGTIQVSSLGGDGQVKSHGTVVPGTTGATWGELCGSDHLRHHVEEGYYVPSLLLRACEVMPTSILGRQVVLECLQGNAAKQGLANIVESQLKAAMVRYLKRYMLGLQA